MPCRPRGNPLPMPPHSCTLACTAPSQLGATSFAPALLHEPASLRVGALESRRCRVQGLCRIVAKCFQLSCSAAGEQSIGKLAAACACLPPGRCVHKLRSCCACVLLDSAKGQLCYFGLDLDSNFSRYVAPIYCKRTVVLRFTSCRCADPSASKIAQAATAFHATWSLRRVWCAWTAAAGCDAQGRVASLRARRKAGRNLLSRIVRAWVRARPARQVWFTHMCLLSVRRTDCAHNTACTPDQCDCESC